MRVAAALVGCLLALATMAARADFYVFAGGSFTYATGNVLTPNVIGEVNSAAAEITLVAAGLTLGDVHPVCSDEVADEVVGQIPAAGVPVPAMTAVDVLVSTGVECNAGRPGVRLRGLRMPGI